MRSVQTPLDQDTLDIRVLAWRLGPIVWDRAGKRRIVPSPVLRNAYETWQAGVTLMTAGLIESIPDMWCQIVWEACRPVDQHLPVKVNVT